MTKTMFSTIAAGALMFAAGSARADVPPNPDDPLNPTDPSKPPPANPMPPDEPIPQTPPVNPTPPPEPTPPPAPEPVVVPATTPTTVVQPVVSEPVVVGPYSYGWMEPYLRSEVGIGMTIGGGLGGFTDSQMRNSLANDVNGGWNARLSVGTHTPLGLEATYNGSAAQLQSFGIDNGTLVGTNVEGVVRYNVLPHFAWTPYAFAGVGWQRYDVVDSKLSHADSGLIERDDMMQFPMGGGISYRDLTGLVFDLRGTFRSARDSDLLIDSTGNRANLDTWEGSASLGYEF
jgi:hypothetical protein